MYAEVKGTPMEQRIQGQAQAELTGACMYLSLANTAKELNLDEVAESFTEIAGEHSDMAVFYSYLNGRYPFDEEEFWKFVKGLSKAEEGGETAIKELANQVEEAGFADAVETVKMFASQHKHHAEVTREMLEKYAPDSVKQNSENRYVCSICGFVYEGDLENEADEFTCPLCGMPKDVFEQE